jgi:hypothetical protein
MIVRYWETWYDTSRTLRSTWYRDDVHYFSKVNHTNFCTANKWFHCLWIATFINTWPVYTDECIVSWTVKDYVCIYKTITLKTMSLSVCLRILFKFHFSSTPCVLPISSPWFNDPGIIRWRFKIMKFFIIRFFHTSVTSSLLYSYLFLSIFFLNTLNLCSSLQWEIIHAHTKTWG